MDIKQEVAKVIDDVIKWRRYLHENPEVGFDLPNTVKYVDEKLTEMNVEHEVNNEKSYIVAWLNKEKEGKTIGVRADMDALPVKEESEVEFKSKTEGKMHACGHDAHTSMLLGVVKVLSDMKNELNGRVKFIFQPAEELGTGAKVVCDDGFMNDVDEIIGLHVGNLSEEATPGDLVFSRGPMLATMDRFKIKVNGKGAHGSTPQDSIDPITISAYIITSLQTIVSREKDPRDPAVVTIGMFNSGSAFNIIPETAEIEGTVRVLTNKDRDFVEKRIGEIAEGVAKSFRANIDYEYMRQPPPVVNTAEVADKLINISKELYPENTVVMSRPVMGGEDFAWYLQEKPGSFFFLMNPLQCQGKFWPHHNPHFSLDERFFNRGMEVMAKFVIDELK